MRWATRSTPPCSPPFSSGHFATRGVAGLPLGEQARRASAELADTARDNGFVTGQLVRIELRAGTADIVNAGHPLPLRLRNGHVEPVSLQADPPFGTVPGHDYRVQRLALEPGDRLMFFTDGIVERNTTDIDIADDARRQRGNASARSRATHHPGHPARRRDGALNDDATALCLDWHGGPVRERTTDSGSNQ